MFLHDNALVKLKYDTELMTLQLQHFHDDTWVSILTKWSYIQLEGEFIMKLVEHDLMSKMKCIANHVLQDWRNQSTAQILQNEASRYFSTWEAHSPCNVLLHLAWHWFLQVIYVLNSLHSSSSLSLFSIGQYSLILRLGCRKQSAIV